MPGAGTSGAGFGPAGFEPLPTSGSVVSSAPAALLFDPNTRDFRKGADGRFVAVHPVDQEVALALGLVERDVGSASSLGNRLRRIARAGGPSLQAGVEDIVRLALKRLTDRDAITVREIVVQSPTRGMILVAVSYENLALQPPRAPSTAKLTV